MRYIEKKKVHIMRLEDTTDLDLKVSNNINGDDPFTFYKEIVQRVGGRRR